MVRPLEKERIGDTRLGESGVAILGPLAVELPRAIGIARQLEEDTDREEVRKKREESGKSIRGLLEVGTADRPWTKQTTRSSSRRVAARLLPKVHRSTRTATVRPIKSRAQRTNALDVPPPSRGVEWRH